MRRSDGDDPVVVMFSVSMRVDQTEAGSKLPDAVRTMCRETVTMCGGGGVDERWGWRGRALWTMMIDSSRDSSLVTQAAFALVITTMYFLLHFLGKGHPHILTPKMHRIVHLRTKNTIVIFSE